LEVSTAIYDDYAQSANALFHFVDKKDYLESILRSRVIVPRYCIEDVSYLNLKVQETAFSEVAVLQKCFCDIPFHKLLDRSILTFDTGKAKLDKEEISELEQKKAHPDLYGKFAIALSKRWGENNRLQPVQYVNENSDIAKCFKKIFLKFYEAEDLSDDYADDVFTRLSYMKPLRGSMKRTCKLTSGKTVSVKFQKNFHDEKEWRYVPNPEDLHSSELYGLIANPHMREIIPMLNESLKNERYSKLWLKYTYDDVRYILVPDAQSRIDVIKIIQEIPDSYFDNIKQVQQDRCVLMSKVLVLDEIGKDC